MFLKVFERSGAGSERSWASFLTPWGSYVALLAELAGWIGHPDVLAGLDGWLGWLADAPRIQGTPSGGGKKGASGALYNHQTAGCRLQAAGCNLRPKQIASKRKTDT